MKNVPNETKDANRSDADASRRSFIKGASVGVLTTMAANSALAQTPAIVHQGPAQDVQAPKGLGRRAMVDQRFPVTYQTSIPQGVSLLTQFFVALSERNLKGIADVVHFPFASFEALDAVLVKTPDDLLAHAPASLNMSDHPERYTDHDGYLKPGAYAVFEGLEVLCVDPNLCCMAMTYNRYGPDGKKLHKCEGVYTATNNDGRWAIQAMSTIFTPAHMVGVVFQDTIEAAKRLRIDHDLAFQVADRSVEPNYWSSPGTSMGVSNGGSPWNLGPAGKAIEQFKVKGVTSRINFTTAEQALANAQRAKAQLHEESREEQIADYAEYRKLMGSLTGEAWGWVYGVIPETRVIHHTYNKAHRFSAAMRFTASGDPISLNTDVGIIMYRKRLWGGAGSMAYTTPHDRSNDVEIPGPLYVPPPKPVRG